MRHTHTHIYVSPTYLSHIVYSFVCWLYSVCSLVYCLFVWSVNVCSGVVFVGCSNTPMNIRLNDVDSQVCWTCTRFAVLFLGAYVCVCLIYNKFKVCWLFFVVLQLCPNILRCILIHTTERNAGQIWICTSLVNNCRQSTNKAKHFVVMTQKKSFPFLRIFKYLCWILELFIEDSFLYTLHHSM